MSLFDFIFAAPYDCRRIARDDFDWGFISTAEVNDGRKPYETAVAHENYREDGLMVIVECYSTRKKAEQGHAKWKRRMTAKRLPAELRDCANAELGELAEALRGEPLVYKRIDQQ